MIAIFETASMIENFETSSIIAIFETARMIAIFTNFIAFNILFISLDKVLSFFN